MESELNANIEKNTKQIISLLSSYNIDLYGITNLNEFKDRKNEISIPTIEILKNFSYAIVFGIKLTKTGTHSTSIAATMHLEEIALKLLFHIVEKEKQAGLIIHTEDEIDPLNRMGILPLKALAKSAGLGWQGRSLLIISPKFGPLYRLIAVLTDMPLTVNSPIENQCGACKLCIDKCPTKALEYSSFNDHPKTREDVLDIRKCLGDNGCKICINVCPWKRDN
jgi:epoxyqueuosine reductase